MSFNVVENPIAPRLRPGEVMPLVPEEKVPTRFHGEIVFVSAPTQGDSMYNNSPYTKVQVEELEQIRIANIRRALAREDLVL